MGLRGGSSLKGAWFYFLYWTKTNVWLDFHMEKYCKYMEIETIETENQGRKMSSLVLYWWHL